MTIKSSLLIAGVWLMTVSLGLAGETTLVTYYPSPKGNYNNMTVGDKITTKDVVASGDVKVGGTATTPKASIVGSDGSINTLGNVTAVGVTASGDVKVGGTAITPNASIAASDGSINTLGNVTAVGVTASGNVQANTMTVTGDASGYRIGLQVNGRIITGDANHTGGLWLDSRPSLFIGEVDNTGTIGLYNNGWRMKVDGAGNVGIGIAGAPQATLDVAGDQKITGNVGIGVAPSATEKLNVNGAVKVTGTITSTSGVILPPTPNGCAGADNCLWIAP